MLGWVRQSSARHAWFCTVISCAVIGCKQDSGKPAPQPPPAQPAPQTCPSPADGATQHVPIRVIRVLYQQGAGGAGDSPRAQRPTLGVD
jgi:hypothetical protein